LPSVVDPNVLVGFATSDDAAVYRLTGELAAVATVDFFTPVVDDPYDFGRVAAANALSDVYAMGARPVFALSIVGFPTKTLPLDVLGAILRGGADVAREAGIFIVGGHSIDDNEPKYGLAVYGLVHPEHVVRNSTARAGDVLILTKPIGTGIVSQAIKKGAASADEIAAAVAVMTTLNRAASEAMIEVGVHAATDVTGFGLLGHLHELAHASGLVATVEARAVTLVAGARRLAEAGVLPGGSKRNRAFVDPWTRYDGGVDEVIRTILCDAQTSGGLLIAVAPDKAEALLAELCARGVPGLVMGSLAAGTADAGVIFVR
jgi:selenide,water dikinase